MIEDDFSKRMFMFNSLMATGLMYGVEIFSWKEWESLETIQIRHIRWCLGLHRYWGIYY